MSLRTASDVWNNFTSVLLMFFRWFNYFDVFETMILMNIVVRIVVSFQSHFLGFSLFQSSSCQSEQVQVSSFITVFITVQINFIYKKKAPLSSSPSVNFSLWSSVLSAFCCSLSSRFCLFLVYLIFSHRLLACILDLTPPAPRKLSLFLSSKNA